MEVELHRKVLFFPSTSKSATIRSGHFVHFFKIGSFDFYKYSLTNTSSFFDNLRFSGNIYIGKFDAVIIPTIIIIYYYNRTRENQSVIFIR